MIWFAIFSFWNDILAQSICYDRGLFFVTKFNDNQIELGGFGYKIVVNHDCRPP